MAKLIFSTHSGLRDNSSLTYLTLGGNHLIKNAGAAALAAVLNSNVGVLQKLDLWNCGIARLAFMLSRISLRSLAYAPSVSLSPSPVPACHGQRHVYFTGMSVYGMSI